jgi:methionyl aminopeptidase
MIKPKKHIFIATAEQEQTLQTCGHYLNEIVQQIASEIKPGITTQNLEDKAKQLFHNHSIQPAFLGLYGFPAILCISINEECVHGIPSSQKIIHDGDIVKIDCGAILQGMFTDMAVTKIAGKPKNLDDANLVNKTYEILQKQIEYIQVDNTNTDLALMTYDITKQAGYKAIMNLGGHGIGDVAHCDPFVANAPFDGLDEMKFQENMVIAIEPIISIRDSIGITPKGEKWVVVSKSGSNVAHFEHTVIIKKDGAKILTM